MEKHWLKNYPSFVPEAIHPGNCTDLASLMEASCSNFKDNKAYTCMGKSLSFGETYEKATCLAAYFENHFQKHRLELYCMSGQNYKNFFPGG